MRFLAEVRVPARPEYAPGVDPVEVIQEVEEMLRGVGSVTVTGTRAYGLPTAFGFVVEPEEVHPYAAGRRVAEIQEEVNRELGSKGWAEVELKPVPADPEAPGVLQSYGWMVAADDQLQGRRRSVVTRPERTSSGNYVLRVGRENIGPDEQGYEVTEHVVLTPGEARLFLWDFAELGAAEVSVG